MGIFDRAKEALSGHSEQVEAAAGGERRQFDDLQGTIGMHRVAVEVTRQPLVAGGGG